ncbi:GatB/YqeY domain-containing protein [Salibacterium lacus]|uniref:GatB/YqeY domain-containing protein n=1 Tax=Salibacterium lacus TaxID=1898109 RepID=A0ABW5SZ22_9BACI
MQLMDRLNEDVKRALKAKDKKRLSVLRGVKSSLHNEAIKEGRELQEQDALSVLNREWKQRRESLHEFENAGRDDLTEEIEKELAILSEYMPESLSEEELDRIVQETITETGASSGSDMGMVMSAVMPKVQGRADGKLVNQFVRKHLT